MPRHTTIDHPTEQLTVRFPSGLLDVIRASAAANDRSLNAEIVNAIRCRARAYQVQKRDEGAIHVLVGSRED
jgi:Arc-like DNA binding domain